MSGSVAEHSRIVSETLIALGSIPWIRVWRNETGAAWRDGKLIHYGCIGSPDIVGILSTGEWIGFEIKSGKAVQTQAQKNFQNMILKYNGHYFVIRDSKEAVKFAAQALNSL